MITILHVEDDKAVQLLVKTRLSAKYNIIQASNGIDALEVLDHNHVDLLLVDIQMDEMDGFEFVKQCRDAGITTPVILLTAMNTFAYKKEGFAIGIDDYVTKPIDYDELIWRIDAVLRRSKIVSEKKIEIGSFVIDQRTNCAYIGEERIELTKKEFELLFKLLSYPDMVFTKQQIMDEIWGYDTETDYNTIKTYISNLRNKFSDCKEFELVSIRGLGYKSVLNKGKNDEK